MGFVKLGAWNIGWTLKYKYGGSGWKDTPGIGTTRHGGLYMGLFK